MSTYIVLGGFFLDGESREYSNKKLFITLTIVRCGELIHAQEQLIRVAQ